MCMLLLYITMHYEQPKSETGKTFMINTCSKKDLSILSYDFSKTTLRGLS
jgi:hypothetical protein